MKPFRLSLTETLKLLRERKISPLELVNEYKNRVKEKEGNIDAYLSFNWDEAEKRARELEKEERDLALYGIPFAIKDNILVKNLPNTCGSKILENFIAPYDAFVIEKIKKYGGIIIGKTNMDEFAMGSSTENSAFKVTKNPWDTERVPGGSSGGSAAVIASDMALVALGSDTGGSVRQPASFCGVVGLKPTYGLLSRFGLVAFASSLDQIGIFGKTVEDTFYVLNLIQGYDERDSTSLDINYNRIQPFDGKLKIGIIKEINKFGIEDVIVKNMEESLKALESMGHKIVEVSLPNIHNSLPVYYLVAFAEASSNLARYDGVRYGLRVGSDNLKTMYTETRKAGFGKEVKRRILLGTFVLSSGYYEQWYLKASKVRKLITNDFEEAFKKVDVLFFPTSPTLPFKIGERIEDPLKMYLADVMTVPVNLSGIPGINVPTRVYNGLPVGMQIVSNYLEENKIYRVALDLEKSIPFERKL